MIIGPRRYFPWKLGRKFFFRQLAVVVGFTVFVGFSIRYEAYEIFSRTTDTSQALGQFDRYLTSWFLVIIAIFLIYLALLTRANYRPLGRLIQRARTLRRSGGELTPAQLDEIDDDAGEDEPGEWSDLERVINRIHRDLKKQTTALAREREELSALLGAVSDAILAVDIDGEALFYNSQFALIFKSKKASRLHEIFRSPEILEAYREVLKTGVAETVNTTLTTHNDHANRHFSVSIAPLKMKDEETVYGAVGVFHDVTELHKAEQIRIEFVANASHELRTPLTSVKGYLETLKQDVKDNRLDSSEKFFEIISRNVDRLISLTNDLLDLSSIESGAELKKSNVSTREITDSVLRSLEEKRLKKKTQITTDIKVESVFGDPGRVEQVLTNLVDNAIKYIPESSHIEISWKSAANNDILLSVKDNGAGIPREHHARLFERFYRVDNGRSRDQGGTGLGLSIIKHIMLKHGGSIQLKSEPGHGSEFICRFPN